MSKLQKINSVYKWKHMKNVKNSKASPEEKKLFIQNINKVFNSKTQITKSELANYLKKESKVTILTPMYNNGKYKKHCIKAIKSVLQQTHSNWEMIIIDDHSTDGTYEYVTNYVNKLNTNKIKIIRNSVNKGCYVSLNEGIINSSGDYITRLDSDDSFVKNKLELQVNLLDKNKHIVSVFCSYKRDDLVVPFSEISAMYRRNIIKKIGYYDSVRFAADSEFRARINKTYGKNKIIIIDKILYHAYTREKSLTTSKETGRHGVGYKMRKTYSKRYKKWHASNNKLYIHYPLLKRPFIVPGEMLS